MLSNFITQLTGECYIQRYSSHPERSLFICYQKWELAADALTVLWRRIHIFVVCTEGLMIVPGVLQIIGGKARRGKLQLLQVYGCVENVNLNCA